MSRARDTAEVAEEIDLKVDYSTPVNEQTGTSYTFQLADARKLTTASSASAVTLTIPPQSEVTWENDTILRVVNYGAGAVTVAGGSGVTVTNTATTLAQFESATAIRTGSDAWTLVPFGSKDTVPSFVEFLVIAGGGGAGRTNQAGGGGGGGYRSSVIGEDSGGGSVPETPLFPEKGTTYTITVGAGGAGVAASSGQTNGSNSVFNNITSVGGGAGGTATYQVANSGGSGGGGGQNNKGSGTVAQGFDGGLGAPSVGNDKAGGGGGGAGGAGQNGTSSIGGNGGLGVTSSITGSAVGRAGGGGGGRFNGSPGTATDGGGDGNITSAAESGTANTGGGGGGSGSTSGGNGGSGVVILRHANTSPTGTVTGSPIISSSGDYTVYIFNASGTIGW